MNEFLNIFRLACIPGIYIEDSIDETENFSHIFINVKFRQKFHVLLVLSSI